MIQTRLSAVLLGVLLMGCTSSSPLGIETPISSSLLSSTAATDPGREQRVLDHEGRQRTYSLYTPSGSDASAPLPLVIGLHGGLGNGEQFARTSDFDRVAEAEGFLVVYPDGINKRWNDGRNTAADPTVNDVSFMAALIEEISTLRSLDRDRVYVTGISNGGFMTARLACTRPDLFAGFGIVAATLPEDIDTTCSVQNPGPVLIVHGTDDAYIPYRGGVDPSGNRLLSVPQATRFWAQTNGCGRWGHRERWPDQDSEDGTFVIETQYRRCEEPVTLLKIQGGGHTWPGGLNQPHWLVGVTSQELSSQQIWDFFEDQVLDLGVKHSDS